MPASTHPRLRVVVTGLALLLAGAALLFAGTGSNPAPPAGVQAAALDTATPTATPANCTVSVTGSTPSCSYANGTYHYLFGLYAACPAPVTATIGIAFEVAPGYSGPWTAYDSRSFSQTLPPGSSNVQGTFTEGTIPAPYAWYRFHLVADLSNSQHLDSTTVVQPLCNPITPTVTATPTGYTLQCSVWATGANGACTPPGTYSYDFGFYIACGISMYGSGTVTFDAAADPGGPWTSFAQQTFSGTFQPGQDGVSGSFDEPGIPSPYAWYRIAISAQFVGGHGAGNSTTPAPLCGAPPATSTATASPTATATPVCPPAWGVVSSPNAPGMNILNAVAAIAPDDVWAVGFYTDTVTGQHTLAEHWNGTAWSIIPSPDAGPGPIQIKGVGGGAASDDVWAVGTAGILHYDGRAWAVATTAFINLTGVTAVAAKDVWAVSGGGIIVHWDGSTWSQAPAPDVGQLQGIDAVAATDIWAVGSLGEQTLTEHYAPVCTTPTPNPTVRPTPTLTCVPSGAVSCGTTSCNGDTYNYDFTVTLSCGLVTTVDMEIDFRVSTSPGGPWTQYDQQTIPVYVPPGGQHVTGSFVEPSIPPQYTDYQFRIVGPQWFWMRTCTEGAPLCRAPTATSTAAPPATASATALVTQTGTPLPPSATPPVVTGTPTAPAPPTGTRAPSSTPQPPTPTPCAVTFADVHPSDYFYTPVRYLACRGVISGYADGTFRPYSNTTRAQMVKIVVLGFGKPIVTPGGGQYTFADVPPAQPFFAVIETAAAGAIVSGYTCGGPGEPCDALARPYFRPNANVTRGQLSKITVGTAGWALQTPASGTFADVAPGSAFYPFVETAACHGLVSGYTCGGPREPCDMGGRPYFRPYNNATRGQIAKIVYGAILGGPACTGPAP